MFHYIVDVLEVIRKQVHIARATYITFRTTSLQRISCIRTQSEVMGTYIFKTCEKHVRQRLMASAEKSVLFISDLAGPVSVVRMLHVLLDKTEMSSERDTMVAYPVLLVLLNVLATFRHFLIAHGYTKNGFPSSIGHYWTRKRYWGLGFIIRAKH